MNKLKSYLFILTVLLLAVFVLTTCDSPLGMGDPIDWEAPVLTLDPVPNPLYVHAGTVLTGKVTDNVKVDRVVFLDTKGKELFPVTLNGDNFTIYLEFSDEYNGEKIVAEIRAYDKMGNSGGTATKFITMIIDIEPPFLDKLEINRTDAKVAQMQKYSDLIALEGSNRQADLYKYQNGWFYMSALLSDGETKVKLTTLEFYDSRNMNLLVLSLDIDEGEYTAYHPRWTVKEEDIINAGQAKFGGTYKTDYYNNHARYYYRVVVKALDMSDNENKLLSEDEGFICLWADSDKPRGVVDPAIVGIIEEDEVVPVSKNTSLPINFYDDDTLIWAYTGLLKKAQWDAISGADKNAKLLTLKQQLTGAMGDSIPETVPLTTTVDDWAGNKITEQIQGRNLDEKLVYLVTSNSDSDYGDYVLFSIAADKKLSPHPTTPAADAVWTIKNSWAGEVVYINLKDENAPLIVFDTTATPKCPEENTFPETLESGKYFYIVGYTLRENGNGTTKNQVKQFRMAWIPYNIPGGQDAKITAVQKALSDEKYGTSGALFATDSSLAGIQHWDFDTPDNPTVVTPPFEKGLLKLDSFDSTIPGSASKYTKQTFSKRFNVMGDDYDDVNTSTRNFMYDYKKADGTPGKDGIDELENETKLFIFYALDSMGNKVYRQLPILGFKSNPVMSIYDITYKLESMPSTTSVPSVSKNIPNPTVTGNFTESTGAPTDAYYALLNEYNKYPNVITALKNASDDPPIKEAEPFQIYPRGTTVKYWVKADENRIPIATLTMKDITYASTPAQRKEVGSGFNLTDKTFSFCEYYPDVTQRTFLFEATDKLGNVASVQRTVAVSNAARLESITTTEQSGIYGHGKVITLQANFSSQIYVANTDGTMLTDQTKKPKINFRYKLKGQAGYVYGDVTCNTPAGGNNTNGFGLFSTPTISLSFNFTVPENADSDLETYNGDGDWDATHDRPITLGENTRIMDQSRKDSAFIPGYSTGTITMPNWTTSNNNSLQSKKKITLDGVHPRITAKALDTSVNGVKAPYSGTGASAERYFKTGESITLILTSDKDIRASGYSRLQYSIQPATGSAVTYTGNYFKYQKPVAGNPKQLVYSLKVDASSCPIDGELLSVSLYQYTNTTNPNDTNNSDILDNADNNIVSSTATNLLSGSNSGRFFIKQKAPEKPAATLSNTDSNTTNAALETVTRTDYKGTVTLKIPNSGATAWSAWEDRKQYSLDGGSKWLPDPTPATTSEQAFPITTAGTYNLQARYIDRAGNTGVAAKRTITIGDTFPALVSVNTVQANGWYIDGKTLTFNLNFADTVKVDSNTQANLSITLKNRGTSGTNNEITLTTNKAVGFSGSTITFNWSPISGKEMRDGLYISNVVLTGLSDKFGITGPTGTGTFNGTNGTFTFPNDYSKNCPNLAPGIKVDAIAPTVGVRSPVHSPTAPSGNALIKSIEINFSEPVMKGNGTITIRPKGNYAIPPVLDDTGYYLGYASTAGVESTDGSGPVPTRYSSAGTNRTYISSFYDIYTNSALNATDRGYLLAGNSMSDHNTNSRTGQSSGPYKKTTHGLIEGPGYTGNYSGGPIQSGANSPNLGGNPPALTAMIPDTATKWVLDYQYGITENATAVNNIRNTLTKAKWRWQEIDVVNALGENTTKITINLNEPLLKGLEWEVIYPEGTFTDLAGNKAPAANGSATPTANNYYFTTPGVQAPVVRVNRRSYDGRTSNWSNIGTYADAGTTTNWDTNSIAVSDSNGWGISSFNSVHYRVESETLTATVSARVFQGAIGTGAARGAWANGVQAANDNVALAAGGTDREWTATANPTVGSWILPNIIRRATNGTTAQQYSVITKGGGLEVRTSQSTLRMYRSYNKDLTKAELNAASIGDPAALSSNGQGVIKYRNTADTADDPYKASKSYVIGSATTTGLPVGQEVKGYEGVFRTVIMFNYDSARDASNYIAVEGSNVKNGMPSIAGFPVRDADEKDCRYLKVFYADQTLNRQRYYWVSTEIVCEWYFLSWGNGVNGTHQSCGEINNYQTVGYGDLTYGFNISRF